MEADIVEADIVEADIVEADIVEAPGGPPDKPAPAERMDMGVWVVNRHPSEPYTEAANRAGPCPPLTAPSVRRHPWRVSSKSRGRLTNRHLARPGARPGCRGPVLAQRRRTFGHG